MAFVVEAAHLQVLEEIRHRFIRELDHVVDTPLVEREDRLELKFQTILLATLLDVEQLDPQNAVRKGFFGCRLKCIDVPLLRKVGIVLLALLVARNLLLLCHLKGHQHTKVDCLDRRFMVHQKVHGLQELSFYCQVQSR